MILWINLVTDTLPAIALGMNRLKRYYEEISPEVVVLALIRWCWTSNYLARILQAVIVLSVYGFALAAPVHPEAFGAPRCLDNGIYDAWFNANV